MRRFLSSVLTAVWVLLFAVPCFAATPDENLIMPRFTYFKVLTAGLSIDEDTGVSSSNASSYSVAGYTDKIVCKLQRERTNGWLTLKTWTATGADYASIDQDWAVYSGYNYRIVVTFSVLDSDGTVLETLTKARYYDYT
jgi:hypothetical protein